MAGMRLHHVAIICSDVAQSVAFYQRVCNAQVIAREFRAERQSHKVNLQLADGTQLELFTFPGSPARVTQPEALGLRHLAFAVERVEDEVSRLAKLDLACEPIRVDASTGKRYTFLRDPDGLPIELYEQ